MTDKYKDPWYFEFGEVGFLCPVCKDPTPQRFPQGDFQKAQCCSCGATLTYEFLKRVKLLIFPEDSAGARQWREDQQ